MRLVTVQRRRSWAWWGAFFFAVVTVGAYVVFDVLDVDGSQTAGRATSELLVAEEPQAEACRLVCADAFTPDATGPASLSLPRRVSPEVRSLSLATVIRCDRVGSMLPRQNLYRELARTSASSADPA